MKIFSFEDRGAVYLMYGLHSLLLGLLLAASGCAFYSFTGATIPQRLNTIAIPLVEDGSGNPFTALDNELTQLFIDRFVEQTRLSLETNEGEADVVLNGRITGYQNEPTAVSGEERATLNRVTVTVNVRYFDQVEDEALLERSFSGVAEYDPATDGVDGERAAARAAIEDVADDVFSAATSNW